METSLAISPDNEICEILACLPEKFIVDFANGIDVADDHIRTQNSRGSFFSRMYDGFTGQGVKRQAEINASLVDGVEGALVWLTELTEACAKSNYALTRVNQRVASIQRAITKVSHYSADTRSQLESFSRCLNNKVDQLSNDLSRVACEQEVERQLDRVFNKWAAGKFVRFSFAARCYVALEELRWGVFGDFYQNCEDDIVRKGFLDDLANRAIRQLTIDANTDSPYSRSLMDFWLARPKEFGDCVDSKDALTYIGNWSTPSEYPYVFATSQFPMQFPKYLPCWCSAERVAERLVQEVFELE